MIESLSGRLGLLMLASAKTKCEYPDAKIYPDIANFLSKPVSLPLGRHLRQLTQGSTHAGMH